MATSGERSMLDPGSITAVRILGDEYRVRGASGERISALATFVDEKFQEMQSGGAAMDLKRLAVLVSLNIAEEMFMERDQRSQVSASLLDRARRCREELEFSLGPGG